MIRLPVDLFKTIVTHTPLVSIDLVVQNASGKILLGQRINRPAQGFWFVPGGRVRKNETLEDAFTRLTESELGTPVKRSAAKFLGVYEHFYEDCFAGEGTGTHYVVLGHMLTLGSCDGLPREQHSAYRWLMPAELLNDETVHDNTKAYFRLGTGH